MKQSAEANNENRVPEDGSEVFEAGNFEVLSINDSLQVAVAEEKNSSNYYSRVENIEDGRIVIAWPTQRGLRLPVRRDQKLDFTFLHDRIPFVFSGIVDETNSGSLPEITIIPSGPVVKTQRRHNFRVKCLVPVELNWTAYPSDSNKGKEGAENIKTSTYDLSAGGIGIRWKKAIPEGTPVEIKLDIPDDGLLMKIPCRIAYTEKLPDNPSMSQIGIQFLAISEREQARIIRYLNRLQIQSLNV
jgi:c-di-GMP-binding flagellar brake protein YcgR